MVGSILVVDDDTPIRDLLEISLQMTGCSVRAAGSGEEALELIHRERFDLIVSDIVLPGMSGLQVLQRARAVDPTVLVVLVTGYATVETAVEALRYGAEDYVVKPFEVDTLRRRIRQLLRGRGTRGDEPAAAGAGGGGPA
ncbi:MAG: response regulator, partial [Candidatus Rokuibacteriota bacterium]